MKNQKLLMLFSVFISGCTWIALAFGLFAIRLDDIKAPFKDINDYNTIDGEIVSSKVAFRGGVMYGGWQFEIYYKYVLDGKEYVSDKVHFLSVGNRSTDAYALKYVEKYPIGKDVLVYYEKTNPSKSVLEPENYSNSIIYFVIVLITIAIIHFLFMIWFYRYKGIIDNAIVEPVIGT